MSVDPEVVTPEATSPPEVRWGMGDALAGNLAIYIASFAAFAVAVAVFGPDVLDGDMPLWRTALFQVPVWVGLLGAPLWATYRKGLRSLVDDFGLRMRWVDIPLGLGIGLVGQLALALVVTVVYRALGIDLDRVGESAEALTGAAVDPFSVVLLVLVAVVVAPVLEELFYRGLWLRAAERRIGRVGAVLLTSAVFGIVHLQPYDFVALAGFGLLLGVLTVRTGRLGPAIWAHVAFNLTAVINLLALSS
ncbi:MAG TPA: type II CAAX endopeptidase family protein [Acidimicrobiales bacterium]|nr:type II CAAX endopeptidase family protein [Acidimicrobiales bacterium]